VSFSKIDSSLRASDISADMRQRLPLTLRTGFFVMLVFALASSHRTAFSQFSQASSRDCYASLSKAKLVTSDSGWAIVNQPTPHVTESLSNRQDCDSEHLYWTDNDG
jgi:hypothetical protein